MTLDERIGRYLAKCPAAVSGQDGHGTTYKVACALVNGFALEPDAALRWMLVYNAGCMPPWKPRELRHKIEQAAKKPHGKPRGHLLGGERNGAAKVAQTVTQSVPVRLQPREGRFRTLRTVFSEPYVKACAHTCVRGTGKQSSVPSAAEGVSVELTPLADDGLVAVPGCRVKRPEEIPMADEDWQKLDASGFANEPLVQMAAWMFGPGCTVLETGRAAA